MAGKTYKKRKDCATMDGEWYEVLVALLAYLRLRNSPVVKKFRLASNVDGAGAFDDVVFNYTTDGDASGPVWHTCFVQLKHKVKAKLGLEQLFAGESKGFSLPKYLKSYNEVKINMTRPNATEEDILLSGPFETANFIIFTNATLHKSLKHKQTQEAKNSRGSNEMFIFDDLLKSRSQSEAIFQFTRQEDQVVFKRLEGDEAEVKEFLDKLTIFSGQCRVSEMEKLIKDELLTLHPTRGSEIDRLYDIYKTQFQVWWRDSEQYLDGDSKVSEQSLIHLDIEQKSFVHLDSFRLGNINFSEEALFQLHESLGQCKSFVHVSANNEHLKITTTKIQRMFQAFPALTIYSTVEYFNENVDLLNHWLYGTNNTIVLVANLNLVQGKLQSFIDKINNILDMPLYKDKTIILVSEGNDTLLADLLKSHIPSYKHIEEYYSFDHLDEQTKKYVGNISIPFQNCYVPLKSLFDNNIQKLEDFLSNNPNLGASLVCSDIQPIGQMLPSELACFIPRSLRMRNAVWSHIFASSESTDVFLVTGVTADRLEQTVGGNNFLVCEKEFSMEPFYNINFHKLQKQNLTPQNSTNSSTPLFLIIEDVDGAKQFNQLCLSYSTVHWLHVESESGMLVWRRSAGDLGDIKKCMSNKQSIVKQSCLLTLDSKLDIVIGEAGMGKTTLLENVANEMKKANPQDWIIFVNLRQNSDSICNETDAVSFLTAVGLSSRPSLLEKLFFNIAINDVGNVIVICDGFDEVCPQYEKITFNLLEQIQKTKVKKLIISSRFSLQNTLETRFATLSKEVVGLSNDETTSLLTYYGIQTSKGYAGVQSVLNSGETLLSTPLLTMLFAEVFKGSDENSRQGLEKFNLFYLVELFVEKKFKLYFGKRKTELSQEEMKDNFFKNHFIAALKVFNIIRPADLGSIFSDKLELSLKGLESGGIIHSVTNQKPLFIHQTFAEYFVAYGLFEYTDEMPIPFKEHMFVNIDGLRYMVNNMSAKESELHEAVLDQNLAKVDHLLFTKQCSVDSVTRKGRHWMHLAASLGFGIVENSRQERFFGPRARHVVELFLENGHDVDCRDEMFSWTPLQYAFGTSSLDAAEYLLANNASKENCIIPSKLLNKEVLCVAINNGFVNVLKLMLSQMKLVYPNVIHAAVQYDDPDIVDAVILKTGKTCTCIRNGWNTTVEHLTAQYDKVKLFRKFCKERGAENIAIRCLKKLFRIGETDGGGRTHLHVACDSGAFEMVEYLIAHGATVDRQDNYGWTPLHVASLAGRTQVVDFLLSHGADINRPDKAGRTPLHAVAQWGDTAMLEHLVRLGADIDSRDKQGSTSLHIASSEGKANVVQLLAALGADFDIQNNNGMTPLDVALTWSRSSVIAQLASRGAAVARLDKYEWTPLHVASLRDESDGVERLVSLGTDVDKQDNMGRTPLYVASQWGGLAVVEQLVSLGADINRQDKSGWTPLHVAAREGRADVVDKLVSLGADIDRRDNNRNTPGDIASMFSRSSVMERLFKARQDL